MKNYLIINSDAWNLTPEINNDACVSVFCICGMRIQNAVINFLIKIHLFNELNDVYVTENNRNLFSACLNNRNGNQVVKCFK